MQCPDKNLVAQPLWIHPAAIKPPCTTMQFPNVFVEVRASPLPAAEADVFIWGLPFCHGYGNGTFVVEKIEAVKVQKLVDAGSQLLLDEVGFCFHRVFDIAVEANDGTVQATFWQS